APARHAPPTRRSSDLKVAVLDELRQLAEAMPGNNYEFTQPIQMRFNELISGVRADVAIKVHGDDMDELARLGAAIAGIVAAVPRSEEHTSELQSREEL